MVQLTEVMRQKDDVPFVDLLNNLRLKKRAEQLSSIHQRMLDERIDRQDTPNNALHVFAFNKDVDQHNEEMLIDQAQKTGRSIKVSHASDVSKTQKGRQIQKLSATSKSTKGDLPNQVRLCIGARVVLTSNIDVNDGLVNGSFGTVKDLKQNGENETFESVFVKFDKKCTGIKSIGKTRM